METDYFTVRSDVNGLSLAILEVVNVAEHFGVKAWLCYGALLGMVREGRLLPWNNDAELGCWYEAGIEKKLKNITDELNNRGYRVFYYMASGSISVRREKNIVVNLNCFWLEKECAVRPHETTSKPGYAPVSAQIVYWAAVLMTSYPAGLKFDFLRRLSTKELFKALAISTLRLIPKGFRKRLAPRCYDFARQLGGRFQKTGIPMGYFDGFSFQDFYGGKVLVPDNAEHLLRFLYGESWRTPKDSWSFYADEHKSETEIKFLDEMWDYEEKTKLF